MFKPTNQLLTILLGVLAIQVGSYDCAKPLPEQLHCSSTLFYKNSDSLDIYNVDEYLDIRAKRSSVRVEDKTQGETRIYYNQVAPKSSAPRRLIMYEPASKNCKPLTIGSWQLSDLRRIAIYMGDMYELKEEFIEIPIGPSVLLFAVNNNLAQFKYVGDTYSKARLSQMHVYSYELLFTRPDSRRMWINLMVHVPKQANSIRVPQVDEPLVEYMDTMEGSTSVARVVLVAACIMNMEPSADDYIAAHDLKKGGKLDPTKLDEDDFCPRDRLLFSVHYNIVGEHLPGTLTGKTFNQARFVHDFNQEPFLLPIGIGCWGSGNMGDDNGAGAKGQLLRQLAIGHPERFSAVYITSQGFKGALFVAYDRAYNLLRLDRDGRKSIFDLANRKSYHVGEFSSSSSGAVGAEIERCVILDMDWMSNQQPDSELSDDEQHQLEEWLDQQPHDPLGSSSGDGSILEKVIGLSHDETRQHYLGTRIIDHVAYEVFESEIRPLESGHFNVPLSLVRRRTLQKTPEANGHLRMFITFYATIESDSVAMLKYIDLWMFDTKSETRYIVNRLKFIEFSWSLDVEPVNDVESQASGDGFGLFSIEPCYQNRASQAELVLDFRQFTLSSNSQPSLEQGLSLLKANEELIRNNIAQVMVNKLELERLNVVDLKVEIRPDGNLISSSRIVELRNGLLEMKQLGFIDYANDFNHIQDYVKQKKNDAHWLRDCQLTSISWPESNWAAYCPLSARCLILSPQEGVKKYFAAPSREKAEICVVYSLKYSTVDTSWTESGAVVARTDLRMWRLSAGFFSLSLDYWRGNAFNSFVYEARPLLRKFHVLDSMLGRQDQAYATGLRHTTADEDDAGINTNLRVALASSKMDGFQHCQLACQMDERCASFSYCTAPKSSTAAASSPSSTSLRRGEECVLSSLRLTRNRLASLVEAHTATKEARVELRVTNECESQSFIMMRDDSCSLHPRDFLADYKMASEKFSDRESGSGGDNQTTQQASGQGAPATNGNDEEHRTQVTANQANPLARSVSLEECAGSSFERCAYQDPEHNQFIYCPLESLCLLQSNDDSSSNATKKQMTAGLDCFVYIKRPSSIYLRKHFSQVSFNFRMPKANEKTGVPMLSAVSKITEKNQYNESISRDLAGLDAENCARECNLHRSKCLAFDSCWVAGHYFCRLYSVRSPLSGVSAYLPQSRLEKSMDEMFVYKLISTSACSHFSLKPGYFEVRLRQILDKEPKAMDNLDGADGLGPLSPNDEQPEPKPANEVRLDEMEGLIMSSDEEKSKLELEEVKKETEQNIEAVQEEEHRASVSHSIGIHFIFLLVGLLLGCTGAIFKEELAHVIRIAASRSTQMATGSSIGSSNQFPFTRHDDTTGIVLEDSLQQTSDEAHNAAGGMA